MLGSTTDAVEIASFVNTTGNLSIPKSPEAIEEMLGHMLDAGLVERRSLPPGMDRGIELFGAYALSEDGWARARELGAAEEEPPGV